MDFEKSGGLIPAIVQEFQTNEVLMLAYMNKEALNLSLETGFAHYFSRSKNRIWKKGEESGNTQEIKSIWLDCDSDTLLLKVIQNGVACHTGAKSCFFNRIDDENFKNQKMQNSSVKKPSYSILDEIYHTCLERKFSKSEKSYTSSLYKKGENSYLKKIAEEASEFILSCKDLSKAKIYDDLNREKFGEHKNGDPKYDTIYEGADLIFHIIAALADHGIHPENLINELKRRQGVSGLDEKKSRK